MDRCVRIIYGKAKSENGKFPSDLHWEKQNILKLEGLLLKSFVLQNNFESLSSGHPCAYLINDLFKKC